MIATGSQGRAERVREGGTISTCVTCLGLPTGALSPLPQFPLSGFHRNVYDLRLAPRPVLLFIGTVSDDQSAIERWPVVKALVSFGRFSGIRALDRRCTPLPEGAHQCTIPTYGWSTATYRSRYVDFQHADLLDSHYRSYQRISGRPLDLFYRYAAARRSVSWVDIVIKTLSNAGRSVRTLPLIAIGSEVQTVSQVMTPSDLEEMIPPPKAGENGIPRGFYFRRLWTGW
jgi:hypothetical protein